MVFSDDFLHFLKIKKKNCQIHQNYLVALISRYFLAPTSITAQLCICFFSILLRQKRDWNCYCHVTLCFRCNNKQQKDQKEPKGGKKSGEDRSPRRGEGSSSGQTGYGDKVHQIISFEWVSISWKVAMVVNIASMWLITVFPLAPKQFYCAFLHEWESMLRSNDFQIFTHIYRLVRPVRLVCGHKWICYNDMGSLGHLV